MLFMEEKTRKNKFLVIWRGGVGLACGLEWPQTLEFAEVRAWLQEQKHGSELCRVSDLCILFRIRLMNITSSPHSQGMILL